MIVRLELLLVSGILWRNMKKLYEWLQQLMKEIFTRLVTLGTPTGFESYSYEKGKL